MSESHTTLRIKAALMRQAKAHAKRHNLTLTAVMERALAAYLAVASSPRGEALTVPTFGRGGVRRGVELDDTSALLDVMDGVE